MKKIHFVLPGIGKKWHCGGFFSILNLLDIAKKICFADIVTYQDHHDEVLFLKDVLKNEKYGESIFLVCWGSNAYHLLKKMRGYDVANYLQSLGWNFNLPIDVPMLMGSRFTMGQWVAQNPNAHVYYLPNLLPDEFYNMKINRDIDILYIARKSSSYLNNILVPELRCRANVFTLKSFIPKEDLILLFNRSKVYLYDSHEYWSKKRLTEGFGLQPLEALACGCKVFSNLDNGLSDYLDPGFNCQKIGVFTKEYDIQRILKAVTLLYNQHVPEIFFEEYRRPALLKRFSSILDELNKFFDFKKGRPNNIDHRSSYFFNRLIFKFKAIF